ncbi:30S ribosomal protein S18 [Patescibacteria group bacterium]
MTKQCHFCINNIKKIDYKDTDALKNFIDEQAKIMPKKHTNLCIKHQKGLALAVKQARFLGLLPFVGD